MRVLLVDDDDAVRKAMQQTLEIQGFEVVPAANVCQALVQIISGQFNALVTDLHMPEPGDGFTVVTAMRHFQPAALTVIVSGFPDVDAAMHAISLQADAILAKPIPPAELGQTLRKARNRRFVTQKQTAAAILERSIDAILRHWLFLIGKSKDLACVQLADEERTRYIPEILHSIANRLLLGRESGSSFVPSPEASLFGQSRNGQGYTAAMVASEWRILQSCIFESMQRNLHLVDFSLVIPDLILIADEIHSQLAQSIEGFCDSRANGVKGDA